MTRSQGIQASACMPGLRYGANASFNGKRAMLVFFNVSPGTAQSPYSRAVVIGE